MPQILNSKWQFGQQQFFSVSHELPQCNILEKATDCAYRAVRKYIIEWILSTDMKMHFDHISAFRTKRINGEFNIASNEEDRTRVISMCVKAADLGHAATSWEQHEEWCRRVVTEFYDQGDEEERLGLPKSFLCDRSLHEKEFVSSQIGFINFVVKPLYDELKSMDETLQLSKRQELAHICVANIEANAAHWQRGQKEI
ncbi:3',5'-cyclic phosphodiesterase, putative [Eimeria necatrix]|uniref:3',5'-cyclic phosphodiesterase, putative n=1 Tax=Eimeria necatrix TaxID=51315 RepID=U6N093_9EIME|nr:3',5'-cyclic phosphodiesterase, putative [Eimeria necatrix]CDJ67370.1 3',5'-cyclic phosphodiesterase, putative [Eimeria necatrix]